MFRLSCAHLPFSNQSESFCLRDIKKGEIFSMSDRSNNTWKDLLAKVRNENPMLNNICPFSSILFDKFFYLN